MLRVPIGHGGEVVAGPFSGCFPGVPYGNCHGTSHTFFRARGADLAGNAANGSLPVCEQTVASDDRRLVRFCAGWCLVLSGARESIVGVQSGSTLAAGGLIDAADGSTQASGHRLSTLQNRRPT